MLRVYEERGCWVHDGDDDVPWFYAIPSLSSSYYHCRLSRICCYCNKKATWCTVVFVKIVVRCIACHTGSRNTVDRHSKEKVEELRGNFERLLISLHWALLMLVNGGFKWLSRRKEENVRICHVQRRHNLKFLLIPEAD
uniref:Transmembrane protein n=1 Tax=Syphacia muris TaxID=451379 RepID=A0A0N5AXH8_9BILA